MPRKPNKERVSCQYFVWLLGTRNGVYTADGRSNETDLGRHSLGTRDRGEALERLNRLDLTKAVESGTASPTLLEESTESLLSLDEGRRRYMGHVGRPAIQGGAAPGTEKRYRTVFDKFTEYAEEDGIRYWQQVNRDVLNGYNRWLEDRDYHDKTQYIELTVLKQAIKWLVGEGLLPPAANVQLKLKKPQGTNTYCYSLAEVQAIIAHCRADGRLGWLASVVIALARTGLRISELAGLLWSDVDLGRGFLTLTDTTRRTRKSERGNARSTKSHRNRSLPIHPELRAVLDQLQRLPDRRVFHGPKGGKIKPDTVRNILMRSVLTPLKAKFPPKDGERGIEAGRVHSFRHFFCSFSADNGVSEPELMSWLGHRDSEMIRHYYHQRPDESRRQMGKLPFLGQPPSEADVGAGQSEE